MKTNFIHLRAFSCYSLLENILKIEDIVNLCIKHNMPAIGLTDKNNLFASLEFSLKTRNCGIQPINGITIDISYYDGSKNSIAQIVILAQNEQGYKNILYLSSILYINNPNHKQKNITIEELFSHSEGLIILSAYTEGIIGQLLLNNKYELAKEFATQFVLTFKNKFYFEIMRHKIRQEEQIEKNYLSLAQELNIPLVATNKILFGKKDDYNYYDTFLCIAQGLHKNDANRKHTPGECYFKSQEEMIEIFHDIPSALNNSVYIAQRCSFFPEEKKPELPQFIQDEDKLLRTLSHQGLQERFKIKFKKTSLSENEKEKIKKQYLKRLEYELGIICKMQFAGYFLIVQDFIQWSKKQDIPVGPGRGSGSGSIIAWCLKITDLDPIFFGLIFERFLNPERISLPDFDIDFCQDRRDEVILYVKKKYGDSKVANIITFGSLQAKAAIKDVSRVLGLRFDIANFLTNLIPFNAVSPVTLSQAINEVTELKSIFNKEYLPQQIEINEYDDIDEIKNLISITLKTSLALEGLPRHVSIHAAGIIISNQDIINILPLYQSTNDDNILTQYTMKYTELSGLIKFDFLGLQTLTLISNCSKLLKENNITNKLEEDITFEDKKTYEILRKGKNRGIFQFESSGIKEALQQLQPDCLNDLMSLTSLYRPGPMENISTYISCKFGYKEPSYIHDSAKEILKNTYGVIIYQEQVIEIAKVLAGYTLGQADLLRRAMGKKIPAEMKKQQDIFIKGAQKNGINEKKANEIFNTIAKFAGYGFNKSHAAAYSVISYRTAYLKAHYPLYFFIAILNLEINNSHKINLILKESESFDIKSLPPNINDSTAFFKKYREGKIIFGFAAIRNVGVSVGQTIEKEREKYGKFKNIFDFLKRISTILNKKVLEGLIQSGCLDCIYKNRKELFENVDKLLSYNQMINKEKNTTQISLFATTDKQNIPQIIKHKNWDIEQLIKLEYDSTGIFWSKHPLDLYQKIIKQNNIYSTKDLKNLPVGNHQIKIAAFIHKKDVRYANNKGIFVNISLSDIYDNFEATIFGDEKVKKYGFLTTVKSLVILTCDCNCSNYNFRLSIQEIESLSDFIINNPYQITTYVSKNNIKKAISFFEKIKSTENANSKITLMLEIKNSLFAKVLLPDLFYLDQKNLQFLSEISLKLES